MFKVGDKVIYKGVPKDFKRIDKKAVILRRTFEQNYFVIKLNSGGEILVSTDFFNFRFKLINAGFKTMNIDNLYGARFATFKDVGTMVLNDGSEKYIKCMNNSIESIILVFRAYGNYKDWLKCNGFNDNIKSWKCFYNLVLSCDWKNEADKNISTANYVLNDHIKNPVFYTKMINVK